MKEIGSEFQSWHAGSKIKTKDKNMIEKLDKFYRTRADFPDWMSEDEWHKKEVEIIKECLEPQIRQNLESLLNGIKCPLSMSVMYDKENGVQVDILCQGKDIKSQDNKDRQRVHRSESTGFVVQFPDGTMVQRSKMNLCSIWVRISGSEEEV